MKYIHFKKNKLVHCPNYDILNLQLVYCINQLRWVSEAHLKMHYHS